MRVLLTEGSSTSAREAITALALAGHAVAYCDPAPICLGRFSRLVFRRYRCPPLGTDPDGFRRFLEQVLERDRFDVLVPIHEQGYLVARIADRLRPLVALAAPAFAAFDRLQTKLGFHDLLRELGLPQPPAILLDDAGELTRCERFPFVVKTVLGTAGRGTWPIRSPAERNRALAEIGAAAAGGPILLQGWVRGPLEQAQTVFQAGRLVGFHATRRLVEGAGGGAALKESFDRPAIAADLARIGAHLSWHGALSVDYFTNEAGGDPLYIDANPRLVEPMAATLAGLNLADRLVRVSLGCDDLPCASGRPGVRTRLALQALLGTALHHRSRRALIGTITRLLADSGPFADAREELTPAALDSPGVLPVVGAAMMLLARPGSAQAMIGKGWGAHLLTPEAARRIQEMV
ncbi:ATP-grasp domain-containing protein [Methylorubrum extorquens]